MNHETPAADRHAGQPVAVNQYYLADEPTLVERLCMAAAMAPERRLAVQRHAEQLVGDVRADSKGHSALDRFIAEYSLDSEEGVMLMCLAEAFLRVPDAPTADALIGDKLAWADWAGHLDNDDVLVHAATWGLMLGQRLQPDTAAPPATLGERLLGLVRRIGEPLVRAAVAQAMQIMGEQFVMGGSIEQALARSQREAESFECYSYDMLGEAALTASDADAYRTAYEQAIEAVCACPASQRSRAGVSIKLSALYPRYEPAHAERAIAALTDSLCALAERAAAGGIQLCVDAEESERLGMSLAVFAAVVRRPRLSGWHGLGLAVQAYQKRAPEVIDWLTEIARDAARVIPVRLVKGAYWDSEIKRAQVNGLADYPVYTRKCHTDVAYLACVKKLFDSGEWLSPQFATHNAHTVASVVALADGREFEFQRLHGMGEALYRALNAGRDTPLPCRVYAPVGAHAALLPYLVRRLLENGANTSFVHRIADHDVPAADIAVDPITATLADGGPRRHRHIALPAALFHPRRAAAGHNFAEPLSSGALQRAVARHATAPHEARPVVVHDQEHPGAARAVLDPADTRRTIGQVYDTDPACIANVVTSAEQAWPGWEKRGAEHRADILERAADLYEQRRLELIAMIVHETGRRLVDAHDEVREAIDLLRFYAAEARRLLGAGVILPGPVGEANSLRLRARGVVCCISPWNFPLAIFSGQIAAALGCGNAVIAKPAEQASLCAAMAVAILHEAGVPLPILQLVPGDGVSLGPALLSDARVAGVAFTGAETTARDIARTLAARDAPLATLIAETGGVNALLADSSALIEQLVGDAVYSAFNSAGQRCSALRILAVQADIAPQLIATLRGAMDELVIGDPGALSSDVGPLIEADAQAKVRRWIARARGEGRLLAETALPPGLEHGHFVAPALLRVDAIEDVDEEIFGPVLHLYTFAGEDIEATLDAINALGYGLTFGIHSRITRRATALAERSRAGNVYINRNLVGAVVEAQPFGGRGRSGTGPKAGGYQYLPRFASEQTVSNNTAAAGGNASLLALDD